MSDKERITNVVNTVLSDVLKNYFERPVVGQIYGLSVKYDSDLETALKYNVQVLNLMKIGASQAQFIVRTRMGDDILLTWQETVGAAIAAGASGMDIRWPEWLPGEEIVEPSDMLVLFEKAKREIFESKVILVNFHPVYRDSSAEISVGIFNGSYNKNVAVEENDKCTVLRPVDDSEYTYSRQKLSNSLELLKLYTLKLFEKTSGKIRFLEARPRKLDEKFLKKEPQYAYVSEMFPEYFWVEI